MNPLLFPEVLSVVFDFLPTQSLLTCRLVCHCWNEESCSKLQERVEIVFSAITDVEKYIQLYEEAKLETSSAQSVYPLSIYKFSGHWNANPWQDTIQMFFNNSNPFITSLDLRASGWSLWDFNMFFSEADFPNLTHLSFECPMHQKHELLYICYLQQKSSVVKLSTLQSLEVSELTGRFTPWVCTLLETNKHLKSLSLTEPRIIRSLPSAILESILATNLIRTLSHLHVDYYLTNPQLKSITNHHKLLELKSLSFAIVANVEPRYMFAFLKSCSNTLTSLRLEYEYIWEKMNLDQFQFPPLEKLTHLAVKFLKGSLNSLIMNVKSPRLRSLTLCGYEGCLENHTPLFEEPISLEQLSIISSPKCNFYIDEICTLFPTLKSLKLQGQLPNEVVHSIITKLKCLESLSLSPQRNYFTDEGLVGSLLAVEVLPLSDGIQNEVEYDEDVLFSRPCAGFPCICQLQALKELHLDLNPRLSDGVIIRALSHCENLKALSLKSPKLTDASLLNLVDKLSLESLTFHGGQISSGAIDIAQKVIPVCDVQEITSLDIRIFLHTRNNFVTCRVI